MTKPLPEDEKRRRAGRRIVDRMFRHQKEYWVSRYRLRGARLYSIIGRHRKQEAAVVAMARVFATNPGIKRADVLHVVSPSWYDPTQVCELVRR